MGPSVTHRSFHALFVLSVVGCHFDRDLGEPAETVATSGALESGTGGETAEPLGASETGGGQASTTTPGPGAGDDEPQGDISCRDTLDCAANCVFVRGQEQPEANTLDLFFSCLLECEADTVRETVTTFQLVECVTADCYANDFCEAVEGTGGGSDEGGSSGSSTGGPGGVPDPDQQCVACLIAGLGQPDNLPVDNACLEEAYACQ